MQCPALCLLLLAITTPVDESSATLSEIGSSTGVVVESAQGDTREKGAPTVAVIAHRGLPTRAPDNTLAAFRKALELGVDMLEVDVQLTKDGHLVVLHDTSVNRTTDGRGALRDFTLEELKSLDAGNWFAEEFRNEHIPTLDEVVDILDAGTTLLLEIKYGSPYHMGIEERLIAFIRQHQLEHRVLIKSFDSDVVSRVRRLAPNIPVGISILFRIPFLSLIVHRGIRFGDVLEEDVDFLHVHRIGLTQALIDDAHARGMKVIAWDVNDEKTMRKVIAMGVDAIETDEPELLKKLRPKGTPKQIGRRSRSSETFCAPSMPFAEALDLTLLDMFVDQGAAGGAAVDEAEEDLGIVPRVGGIVATGDLGPLHFVTPALGTGRVIPNRPVLHHHHRAPSVFPLSSGQGLPPGLWELGLQASSAVKTAAHDLPLGLHHDIARL